MWIDLLYAFLIAATVAPLLSLALDGGAPGRADTPARSVLGLFLPTLLVAWGAMAALTASGPTIWGTLWLVLGSVGLVVGILLSRPAAPREPSRREVRRVRRRGELLDPVYMLYVCGVGLGLLTAAVTRATWDGLA